MKRHHTDLSHDKRNRGSDSNENFRHESGKTRVRFTVRPRTTTKRQNTESTGEADEGEGKAGDMTTISTPLYTPLARTANEPGVQHLGVGRAGCQVGDAWSPAWRDVSAFAWKRSDEVAGTYTLVNESKEGGKMTKPPPLRNHGSAR